MLVVIELKLAEVRTPQPDTRIVIQSQFEPLEQLIEVSRVSLLRNLSQVSDRSSVVVSLH